MGAMRVAPVNSQPVERLSIVLAGIDCVVSGGHGALSAVQVADEAGLDVGTVRRHFSTRQALAGAVVDYVSGQILQSLYEDLRADERLRLHLHGLAAAMTDRPGLFVVFAELELWAGRDRLIRAAVKRSEQAWRDALVRLLRDGRDAAVWAREFDDEAIVDLIISTAVGVRLRGGALARTLAQIEAFLLGSG